MKATALLLLMTMISTTVKAKEWRGIKPLHSTKEDVERILGTASETNQLRAKYQLPNEDVYIAFASDDDIPPDCVKKLKPGTVLLIKVTPKKKKQMAEFDIEESSLRSFDPSDPPNIGYRCFIDDKEGVVVRTLNGYVDEINYLAASDDRHLCTEYYAKPEIFCRIIVDIRSHK